MSETREKIIELAMQFIRASGYHGFSYSDIATRLRIRNAAIHYYFPSKCDLGLAVLQEEERLFLNAVKKWSPLPANQQLERFIGMYNERKQHHEVCIMGAMSPAVKTLPENMQAFLKKMGKDILNWLADLLQKGKETGVFHFKQSPRTKSYLIISSLLSSLLLENAMEDEAFETIKTGLLESV